MRPLAPDSHDMAVISSLQELTYLVVAVPQPLHLRYSKGPRADAEEGAGREHETHLTLPGLSVTTITPESWWRGPVRDWVARQICKYGELAEEDGRFAWLLTGTVVGRGPDHEPLLADIRPCSRVSRQAIDEAGRWHRHHRFDVRNDPHRS